MSHLVFTVCSAKCNGGDQSALSTALSSACSCKASWRQQIGPDTSCGSLNEMTPSTPDLLLAVRQVTRDQMELGPTESNTGRGWFLLRSGCDGSRYY